MSSPLTLIRMLELLEVVFIFLFPIALVTSVTLAGILIYAGAVCFALLLILNQKKNLSAYNFSQVDIAFLIYIFAFSLSKVINSDIGSGFHMFFRTCQDYFVYLWIVFFLSKNQKNMKLVSYAVLIAAFISVFYGLFQYFHLDIFHRQINIDRLSGFHRNPYTYGGQLIVFFFFLLKIWYESKRKLIWLSISALTLFCILNTSERAVIFGILIGLVLYLILQKMKSKDITGLSLAVLIPILITMQFHRKVFKRIKNAVIPKPEHTPNIRLRLWGIALSVWKRNILFGMGKFPVVSYQAANHFPVKYLTHAHNVYLQVLATSGLIGFLAFINLFFAVLKTAFYNLK